MNKFLRLVSVLVLSTTFLQAADSIISDGPRSFLNLGGEWDAMPIDGLQFNFPPPQTGWKKETVPSRETRLLVGAEPGPYDGNVPSHLNADKTDFLHKTGVAAWFKRDFTLAKVPAGQRVLLRFHGMSFRNEIWLNGKKIGGALFGQVPTTYDVTDAILSGANQLVVGLTTREGIIDLANQTFLAPASGSQAGIWGKVELEFVPDTRIDDVFVKTSVKNKQLTLEVTLVNAGKAAEKYSLGALITDVKMNSVTDVAPVEVTLAPGESKVVTLTKDWIAPQLWEQTNPALYFVKVVLSQDGRVVDSKNIRFGFREFEIRGRDFYLNGKRVVLLRDSWLNSDTGTRKDAFQDLRFRLGNSMNSLRLHIGFNSAELIDLCDELGVLCMPELSWFTLDNKFVVEKRDLWIPNTQAYVKAFLKTHRNHPSVVIWNLTNESIWANTTPAHMEIADAMTTSALSVDSTRPLQGDGESNWAGRLPITNIHYPESSVGNSLRAEYPNSSFVFPNDYYWLSQDKDKKNVSWNADFKWDRPLVIGEYFYPSGDQDKFSSFMGDTIYDWEKWQNQRLDGRDSGPLDDNEFVNTQQGLADSYRIQGVAGVNPWSSNGAKVIPQVAVRPLDFFPNAFSGSKVSRKFAVFNDSGRDYNGMSLQCRLTVNGETVWEEAIPAISPTGESKAFEVSIQCPKVDRLTKAKLSVRLRYDYGGGSWSQLDRLVTPIFIMPMPRLKDVNAKTIFLFDKSGKTAAALKTLGLDLKAAAGVVAGDLQGVKTLIIGEDSDASPYKDVITDFVKSGGSAVVLRQDQWTPLAGQLPEIDKDHVSTRSWRRSSDHPITRDFADKQFSYWRPDHVVSIKTFRKPAAGRYRILLDAGGLFGLRWSPLLEVPLDKGTFVLSSLDLISRVNVEPMAAQLLVNMIRYAESYQPATEATLRLLAGTNAPLRAALTASGVPFEEGLKGTGPILWHASFEPSKEQFSQIKTFLTGGGNVWLHGFSKDNIAKAAELFPFPPELELSAAVQAAAVRSDDPYLNNLASFDFFWTRVDLEAGFGSFAKGTPTAKIGDTVLKLPSRQAGRRLLSPGFLTKVPSGKGTLLLDTLAWESALGAESEKVTRVVSALAANQGAAVRTHSDDVRYDYFAVDIAKQANMGYVDSVPDDGKGGWTDQGKNDMRFFLINHVGKIGGLETGAVVEGQVFPSEVTLAGRKFWLLDPRKTNDRAVISLRGGEHGIKLPESVKGIPVGRKAETLWFLNAAGWAATKLDQEVARYVIRYTDGSEEVFPIHYDQEISEWWNPKPLSGAKIAWTGNNLVASPIGIYSTEWKNPHPEKEIATIDLIGSLSPVQVVVLAITGGVVSDGEKKETLLGKWRFSDFAENRVPNQVDGGGDLIVPNDLAPTVTEVGGGGLHFADGQRLSGSLKNISEKGAMGEGKPFAVKMTFTPEASSPGVYAGLFEAMGYGSSGFRLVLTRGLKLTAEIFLNDQPEGHVELESKMPLELGRTYTVEIRFNGTYVTLLIDGQVDQMQSMPMPGLFDGVFTVGTASGEDYFFVGAIHDLSLFGLGTNP